MNFTSPQKNTNTAIPSNIGINDLKTVVTASIRLPAVAAKASEGIIASNTAVVRKVFFMSTYNKYA
jgi:hypothetical protein